MMRWCSRACGTAARPTASPARAASSAKSPAVGLADTLRRLALRCRPPGSARGPGRWRRSGERRLGHRRGGQPQQRENEEQDRGAAHRVKGQARVGAKHPEQERLQTSVLVFRADAFERLYPCTDAPRVARPDLRDLRHHVWEFPRPPPVVRNEMGEQESSGMVRRLHATLARTVPSHVV
jgi:hypothetical protein